MRLLVSGDRADCVGRVQVGYVLSPSASTPLILKAFVLRPYPPHRSDQRLTNRAIEPCYDCLDFPGGQNDGSVLRCFLARFCEASLSPCYMVPNSFLQCVTDIISRM